MVGIGQRAYNFSELRGLTEFKGLENTANGKTVERMMSNGPLDGIPMFAERT